MYQPTLGRFLSRDPLPESGPQILYPLAHVGLPFSTPYTYVENNPVTRFDPTGLTSCDGEQPPKPRSPAECCKAAKDSKAPEFQNLMKRTAAAVICCDGRPVPCIWTKVGQTGDKTVDGILDACRLKHENYHAEHHAICKKVVPSLYPATLPITNAVEREAWEAEIECLIMGLSDCAKGGAPEAVKQCRVFLCLAITSTIAYARTNYGFDYRKIPQKLRDLYEKECK
jgi:hypothetical protein